ncbi:hypothetical protein M0Q50_02170 [bacterium]|jgi:hypothetical protein|nr:hypothetical protein [bacterium]
MIIKYEGYNKSIIADNIIHEFIKIDESEKMFDFIFHKKYIGVSNDNKEFLNSFLFYKKSDKKVVIKSVLVQDIREFIKNKLPIDKDKKEWYLNDVLKIMVEKLISEYNIFDIEIKYYKIDY